MRGRKRNTIKKTVYSNKHLTAISHCRGIAVFLIEEAAKDIHSLLDWTDSQNIIFCSIVREIRISKRICFERVYSLRNHPKRAVRGSLGFVLPSLAEHCL